MKKLLVLLALCMVISVVLVACQDEPEQPVDSSNAETTEAPSETESEVPTETESTTETETETESTTETESESESETEPTPDPVKVVAGKSWDSLTAVPGETIFADGYAYMEWENNAVAEINMATNTLDVWGWIAYFTETEGTVGYQINNGEVVYDASFTYTAEVGVQDHITANVPGALSACRMKFSIPVATLAAGEHTVALIAKDPAGNEELIKEFRVIKTVPYVDKADAAAGFNEWSFDGFYANENLYFEQDGQAASKLEAQDKIVPVAYGTKYENIGFRGWVSFNQATEAFGYFIAGVNTEIVYGDFVQARPDLEPAGKVNGVGFNMVVPTADLGFGSYNVSIYAKLADGTIVKMYDITLDILNLVVDTDSKLMTSIDHVNGSGPIRADGTYEPHFNAIGGLSMGKIDAAVAGKTNDTDGIITLGGWLGISGGVNRYVWSVDGVNWFDVVSGGKDGEPLDGHYNSLNTEEGMTSTKNGMFTSGAFITIQLPKEYVGATGTIYVGAIPELNQGSVIIFCELSNFTVSEIVEAPKAEGFTISGYNANGTLYVTGTITGGRFDGSFDAADAAVFYKEDAGEGLYKLYFMVEDAKTYIIMNDKTSNNELTTDAALATVFEWNATLNTHEVAADDNARAFGCESASTYNNFSAYAVSNAESQPDKYNWGQSTPVV